MVLYVQIQAVMGVVCVAYAQHQDFKWMGFSGGADIPIITTVVRHMVLAVSDTGN